MDTNAKVPPAQPATEPPQYQSKPDSPPLQGQQALAASSSVPADLADPTDYRLVIDRDPISGTFVYRTVDRFTGETVNQFPSEDIVRLRDSADYKAGTVFNGKV